MKRRALLALQIAVTAGLLGWLFREPEFRVHAWNAIRSAQPGFLFLAAGVAGAGFLLGFVRWGIFLRMTGICLPPWQILRLGAVGLFFNSFLPGAVGGDAVKIGWLVARGYPAPAALLSAVMDRVSGLAALVLFSAVFMGTRMAWLTKSPAVAALVHLLWIYLACVTLALAISFVLAARGSTANLPERLPGRPLLIEFASTYALFVRKWGHSLAAAGLSGLMLLAYFLTFYFSALSLGVRVPLPDFMAFMPVVDLLAALPVSIGGFGVRESAFVTLLGQLAGVPAPAAVAVSFLGALLSLLWGCAGLLLLPGYRKEIPKP